MAFDDELEDYEDYLRSDSRWRLRIYALLLLILLSIGVVVLWHRMVVSIQSGEAGVLYHWVSGTDLDNIYGEGVHVVWPWDHMYIYETRLQTQERTYNLLTKGGLPVTLQIAVRYRPDTNMLPLLHVTVGREYLNKVVFPETEAVLRRTVGQYEPEEVYTSKRGFLESVVVSSLTNVEDRYVIIDDVLVRAVELPAPVQDAIEQKLTLAEKEKAYEYRLAIERKEAQRKEVEATGIKRYQDIVKQSLTQDLLRWQGIQATRELATSPNAKTVVIGGGKDGLPLILGGSN